MVAWIKVVLPKIILQKAGVRRSKNQNQGSAEGVGLLSGMAATVAGSRSVKVVPWPGFDSTEICPPCLLMIEWTEASPSPVLDGLVVK